MLPASSPIHRLGTLLVAAACFMNVEPAHADTLAVQIVKPASDGETFNDRSALQFRAKTYDSKVGTGDGKGIGSVSFKILKADNNVEVYSHNETIAAYCAFGGDMPPCNGPSSTVWGDDLPDGSYILKVKVEARSGDSESRTRSFTISRSGTSSSGSTNGSSTSGSSTSGSSASSSSTSGGSSSSSTSGGSSSSSTSGGSQNQGSGSIQLRRGGRVVSTYNTVQAAIDAVQPGDTIYLANGVYHENLNIKRSGTASAKITFEGQSRDGVVIDGAIKELQKAGNGLWKQEGNAWWTPYPYDNEKCDISIAKGTGACYLYPLATLSDELVLWTYSTKAYFNEFWPDTGTGIYLDRAQKRLYIRFKDGSNPNNVPLNISKGHVIHMPPDAEVKYWDFKNLTLKHATKYMVYARYVDYLTFDNIKSISATTGMQAFGKDEATDGHVRVTNSTFTLKWNDSFWWSHVKNFYPKTMEGTGINMLGAGMEAANNYVTGHFNGIGVVGNNTSVHHNTVYDTSDDGIEIDRQMPVRNMSVHHNIVYHTMVGLSTAPGIGTKESPIKVYRNIFIPSKKLIYKIENGKTDYMGGMTVKVGSAHIGDGFTPNYVTLCNNTLLAEGSPVGNVYAGGEPHNYLWQNNIMVTEGAFKKGNLFIGEFGNRLTHNLAFSKKDPNIDQRVGDNPVSGNPMFSGLYNGVANIVIANTSPAVDKGKLSSECAEANAEVVDGKPDIGAYEVGGNNKLGRQ